MTKQSHSEHAAKEQEISRPRTPCVGVNHTHYTGQPGGGVRVTKQVNRRPDETNKHTRTPFSPRNQGNLVICHNAVSLEDTMFHETSQVRKGNYYMLSFMCDTGKGGPHRVQNKMLLSRV